MQTTDSKPTRYRDLHALEKVRAAMSEGEDQVLSLKRQLTEAGYNLFLEAKEGEEVRAYCDSFVCLAVVCAFSSSCDGGACAQNGCSALVDHCGFFSNDDPCESSKTCADKACGTGVSEGPDPGCGQKVCGSKSR